MIDRQAHRRRRIEKPFLLGATIQITKYIFVQLNCTHGHMLKLSQWSWKPNPSPTFLSSLGPQLTAGL